MGFPDVYEQEPREVYREERTVDRGVDTPAERAPLARDREVYREERAVTTVAPYNYRAVRVVWLVFTLISALIGIRFLLKMLGASPQASFVSFMYGVTAPLVAPFRGIFPESGQGTNIFEPASLVAIAVYLLLGWAIVAIIRIATGPRSRRTP